MIDTSAWREFKISDLFDVKNSKSISDKRGLDFNENNPYDFIGRTPVNNGIQGKIVKQDFEPNNENTFSVTQIGEKLCLFRDNKWYACQNIFLLTPLYSELITAKFFICCVVTKTLKAVFGEDAYSLYPTKDTLSDMIVKLPATFDGQPDWDYMESYMKAVMEESEKSLENLKRADDTKHLIDVSGWGEFRVGDLFDIHPTKAYKLTNAQLLDNGNYSVIANSAYNNGIGGYSTRKPTEQGNMVTFSDTVDANTIFYQKEPFVGYPHVQGLYPIKYEDKWNELTYQFFVSVFRGTALVKGFDYGNKFRRDIAVELMVKLPITSTGKPDWQYMEDYMKAVMDKSKQIISDLQRGG